MSRSLVKQLKRDAAELASWSSKVTWQVVEVEPSRLARGLLLMECLHATIEKAHTASLPQAVWETILGDNGVLAPMIQLINLVQHASSVNESDRTSYLIKVAHTGNELLCCIIMSQLDCPVLFLETMASLYLALVAAPAPLLGVYSEQVVPRMCSVMNMALGKLLPVPLPHDQPLPSLHKFVEFLIVQQLQDLGHKVDLDGVPTLQKGPCIKQPAGLIATADQLLRFSKCSFSMAYAKPGEVTHQPYLHAPRSVFLAQEVLLAARQHGWWQLTGPCLTCIMALSWPHLTPEQQTGGILMVMEHVLSALLLLTEPAQEAVAEAVAADQPAAAAAESAAAGGGSRGGSDEHPFVKWAECLSSTMHAACKVTEEVLKWAASGDEENIAAAAFMDKLLPAVEGTVRLLVTWYQAVHTKLQPNCGIPAGDRLLELVMGSDAHFLLLLASLVLLQPRNVTHGRQRAVGSAVATLAKALRMCMSACHKVANMALLMLDRPSQDWPQVLASLANETLYNQTNDSPSHWPQRPPLLLRQLVLLRWLPTALPQLQQEALRSLGNEPGQQDGGQVVVIGYATCYDQPAWPRMLRLVLQSALAGLYGTDATADATATAEGGAALQGAPAAGQLQHGAGDGVDGEASVQGLDVQGSEAAGDQCGEGHDQWAISSSSIAGCSSNGRGSSGEGNASSSAIPLARHAPGLQLLLQSGALGVLGSALRCLTSSLLHHQQEARRRGSSSRDDLQVLVQHADDARLSMELVLLDSIRWVTNCIRAGGCSAEQRGIGMQLLGLLLGPKGFGAGLARNLILLVGMYQSNGSSSSGRSAGPGGGEPLGSQLIRVRSNALSLATAVRCAAELLEAIATAATAAMEVTEAATLAATAGCSSDPSAQKPRSSGLPSDSSSPLSPELQAALQACQGHAEGLMALDLAPEPSAAESKDFLACCLGLLASCRALLAEGLQGLEGRQQQAAAISSSILAAPAATTAAIARLDPQHHPHVLAAKWGLPRVGCSNPGCTNVAGPSEAALKCHACSKCRRVAYCSKECQLQDWKAQHKQLCPVMIELLDRSRTVQ